MLNKLILICSIILLFSCKTNYINYSYIHANANSDESIRQIIGFRKDSTYVIAYLPLDVYRVEEGTYIKVKKRFFLLKNKSAQDSLIFNNSFNVLTFRGKKFIKGKKLLPTKN